MFRTELRSKKFRFSHFRYWNVDEKCIFVDLFFSGETSEKKYAHQLFQWKFQCRITYFFTLDDVRQNKVYISRVFLDRVEKIFPLGYLSTSKDSLEILLRNEGKNLIYCFDGNWVCWLPLILIVSKLYTITDTIIALVV